MHFIGLERKVKFYLHLLTCVIKLQSINTVRINTMLILLEVAMEEITPYDIYTTFHALILS